MKKLFIITGEHSGDLHASFVVNHLKELNPSIEIEAIGGENLKRTGIKLFNDHSKMQSMGFNLKMLFDHFIIGKKLLNYLKTEYKPDLVLLIDYGGFNLNIAKFLKKDGFKIYYFIPPQIWASRKWRIKSVKKYIDKVLTIFPFENKLYEEAGINVEYVGHPLVKELALNKETKKDLLFQKYDLDKNKKLVSIFPGSRELELKYLLKTFLKSKEKIEKKISDIQFVIAQANNISDELLNKYLKDYPIKVIKQENYALLKHSDALILASGTVALEAALYGTPMLISYKGPWLLYLIYLLVRCINKVSLPNIILNKIVIKELIQWKSNADDISEEIVKILQDNEYRNNMTKNLEAVRSLISDKDATYQVALSILEL